MSTDYFPWFRFRAADFIGGTAGMTMEERGAYITLMAHQWMHGPLPADPQDLARICGGVTVSKRVTDKFRNVDGTQQIINDKLEEDRAHALKSRDGAKKRQRDYKKKSRKSNALPQRDETVTKQLPSISNTTVGSMGAHGESESEAKEPLNAVVARIWKAYKHKAGKPSAIKAILRDLKKGDQESDILAGVERYNRFIQAEHARGFARSYKDGGGFFNGRMWESDWAIPIVGGQSTQPGGMNTQRTFNKSAHDALMDQRAIAIGLDPYALD